MPSQAMTFFDTEMAEVVSVKKKHSECDHELCPCHVFTNQQETKQETDHMLSQISIKRYHRGMGVVCVFLVTLIGFMVAVDVSKNGSRDTQHADLTKSNMMKRAQMSSHASQMILPDSNWLLLVSRNETNLPSLFRHDGSACSKCGDMQYTAAYCNGYQDTICINISFPLEILPMDKFSLTDDGTQISISQSRNVFVERLLDAEALETAMYVTNNQQSLDFVWPRASGLEIAVSVTDVYLVPDYHDMSAVDDTALFQRLPEPSARTKSIYNHVQGHYCRHPVPDYYSLQLEVITNRTSAAHVVRCDSQDNSVHRCPDSYKDGDRYLMWNINTACSNLKTPKLSFLKGGPNSIVCTDETAILRKVFQTSRPMTQEYMFPSWDCEAQRRLCEKCLSSNPCTQDGNSTSETMYDEGSQCCAISCYSQTSCKKAFSSDCPQPHVECAHGEVHIFSLFPHFDSMDQQFACHLRYVPPDHLYSISYTISMPAINFSTTAQHFTARSSSRAEHERRLSRFDFISALHDTRLKIEDELILIGDHSELKQLHTSLMKQYSVRELKSASDFSKHKMFTKHAGSKTAFVQFERPFLYSSFTWYKDGCDKNVSQIYPNQSIYKDDFTPVLARKNVQELDPSKALFKDRVYTYQLSHRDRAPYVKFFVEKGRSVLQHLQGTTTKGKLVASSLTGSVTWQQDTSRWKLVFAATQDECPSVVTLKIFTYLMTRCAGQFDLFINCPVNFTVTFAVTSVAVSFPAIFVLSINDSTTSHSLILSSIRQPDYIHETKSTELMKNPYSSNNSLSTTWLLIVVIAIVTVVLLVINFICYKLLNARVKQASQDERIMNNSGQEVSKTLSKPEPELKSKRSLVLFAMLYIVYSFTFTFSSAFVIIYISQLSMWSHVNSSQQLINAMQVQINRSLAEIQNFEETERLLLYASYTERMQACMQHLTNENKKLLLDYEKITTQQMNAIFVKNGSLHDLAHDIQKQNVSVYQKQIEEFVLECNKTLNSIVDRFQSNYNLFIRNTTLSDWLKFPRQIFLHQDGEDPDLKYLSLTHVKQFAYWLEIDRTEELFAVKENVFGRLSSIHAPYISLLDVTFPSLDDQFDFNIQEIDKNNSSYNYTTLSPVLVDGTSHGQLTVVNTGSKKHLETMKLSGHSQENSRIHHVPFEPRETSRAAQEVAELDEGCCEGEEHVEEGMNDHVLSKVKLQNVPEELIMSDETISHVHASEAFTSSSSSEAEPQAPDNHKLYTLIAVFIILDIVLWVYRISWLRNEMSAIQHGYVDRVPVDEACVQLLELQPQYHRPVTESSCQRYSSRYSNIQETTPRSGHEHNYSSIQEATLTSGNEPNIIFSQNLPLPKSLDAPQNAWDVKINQAYVTRCDDHVTRLPATSLKGSLRVLGKTLHQIFLNHLVWQGSITSILIIIMCVCVYCVKLWLTPENFLALSGVGAATADVRWQLEASRRYLHTAAQQLSAQLQNMKILCDFEVDAITEVFFATINMQMSTFTSILQDLCQQARGKNCDQVTVTHATRETIVGCNFLPVRAHTFHDVNIFSLEEQLTAEITPMIALTQHLLTVTASVIISLLCCRLLCHSAAFTLKHYLLVTGGWPHVKVYLSEKVQISTGRAASATMQRSQSWVDSCESGVYLGDMDETTNNKDENR